MNRPDRLPTNAFELDEWSVYADYLQTRGDPRGELIAYELALPEVPEPPALRAFHALVKAFAHYPREIRPGISLGYARSLGIFASHGTRLPRGPRAGSLAWARDWLSNPDAQLLEELRFIFAPDENPKHWKRLFAALPRRCTCIHVGIRLPITRAEVDGLVAILPEHVRDVSVSWHNRRGAREGFDAVMGFITDRFDTVDLGAVTEDASSVHESMLPDPALRALLQSALAAAPRVRVRLSSAAGRDLPERINVGRPGDAALVDESSLSVVALPRWPLLALQGRYGILPIRTQLAGKLSEGYSIASFNGQRLRVGIQGADLVRRGDRWTVRGDAERPLRRNERPVAHDSVEPLEDGDRLVFGSGRSWRFVAHI